MWPLSLPRDIDFGCGFQSHLPSGTLASILRVFSISWSNSGSKVSLIVIAGKGYHVFWRSTTAGGQGAQSSLCRSFELAKGRRQKVEADQRPGSYRIPVRGSCPPELHT